MNIGCTVAGIAACLTLAVTPALAAPPSDTPGNNPTNPGNKPATNPGKAYGKYCQNQSKKHVAGQKGTPFSQCVKAMAQLDKGTAKTPKAACKSMSKKHVAGEKGTPYSRCVVAAAKLLKDKQQEDAGSTPSS